MINQGTEKEVKEKAKKALIDNVQKILIVASSSLYILQGLFNLRKTNATIWDIIGNIGISLFMGLFIYGCFSSMGLKDGRSSDLFVCSIKAYGDAKVSATPFFDRLSQWCDYKNTQELWFLRKSIIQEAGLNWKAYRFGYYDTHTEKLTDRQKIMLEEAKKASVPKLISQELLSDLPTYKASKKNNKKFGESEAEYSAKDTLSSALWRIFVAIISGLYTLEPLLTEDNAKAYIAGIIWHSIQVVIWLILGMMKYNSAKSFMENEYRQTHIIQKTEYLNEFVITMQNTPDIINNDEEEIELNQYIQDFIKERESENE